MKIFFTDGTRGFNPRLENGKPTGGILTSLLRIPAYLGKNGHECHVGSLYMTEEKFNGVYYYPVMAQAPSTDIVVYNRNMLSNHNVGQAQKNGSKTVWWLHDIVDPRYLLDDSFKRIDRIIALSRYCADTYADFYNLAPEKFTIIPNGVDKTIWYPPQKYDNRDPDLFVYACSPIKGYKALEFCFHNIKRHRPNARLMIFGSSKLHGLADGPGYLEWLAKMRKQDGIIISDPIPQPELAEVFRRAWALLMPNEYPEICSNLILQAQASGLPVVTSSIGSAPEFVRHEFTGMLTSYTPNDKYMWQHDFTMQVMKLINNRELHRFISEESPADVKTWEEIGGMWNEYVYGKTQAVKEHVGVL